MYNDYYEIKVISVGIILFILFIVGIEYLNYFMEKNRCAEQYEDSKFGYYSGCMIKYDGKYITEELYQKSFIQNINLTSKK